MSSSSLTGLIIGICFMVVSLLIRLFPINSKWLFTLYTKGQRSKANRYLSRWLLLLGAGFCVMASLPLLMEFRGLRAESFLVLAALTLSLCWRMCEKHIGQIQKKNQF
jgi:hypothetical protein